MKTCTHSVRGLCLTVLLLAGFFPSFSQQIQKHLTISTGESIGFLEYKPRDYAKKIDTKYPIIIFLHGIGERGNGTTDLAKVACCGIPRIISWGHNMTFNWNGKSETFLVLSPQCPSKYGMWPEVLVDDLIKYAKENLQIDPERIFLTGLSMGAGGTYKYISGAQKYADNIAASAAICPPCVFNNAAYMVKNNMPFWGWHAADDKVVPYTCTEAAVNKMNALHPAVKPLKVIWPTGGHAVWDRVYTDTNYIWDGAVNVYEWFLGQRKGAAVNKLPIAQTTNNLATTTANGIVHLDASASSDADGHIVRYVWKKISGPNAGVITTPLGTASSTMVSGLTIAGSYQYQLTVVDDRASFAKDTLTVNVAAGSAIPNKAPLAKVSGPTSITLPVSSISLNSTGSSDADGSIAKYAWSKLSGPAASIITASTSVTTVNNLVAGNYVFRLTLTDNKGATGFSDFSIVVNPAPVPVNIAPVAKAGGDVQIKLDETNTVNLSASGSSDADGTIKSILWSKISGPAATILSPAAATTSVSNLVQGVYTFQVTITDNDNAVSSDQVIVTVLPAPVPVNIAPVAKAGGDVQIKLDETNTVNLSASGSSDADGTIKSILWSKISGPAATILNPGAATTSVSNLVQGVYTFQVTVTDNDNAVSSDQVIVTVLPAPVPVNIAPVAKAGGDVQIKLDETNTVNLSASGSSDADGSIKSILWSKISGPAATILNPGAATTSVSNLVQGVYTFQVTVTDNDNAVSSDQVIVTVLPAPVPVNIAPVAKAGGDVQIKLDETSTVNLSASGSSDADGSIKSILWSKISGPAATILNPGAATTSVSNLVQGVYTFQVTVTDNDNAVSSDQVVVTVLPAPISKPTPNSAPIADAGPDQTTNMDMPRVLLKGHQSKDVDGYLASFYWTKINGPASGVIENNKMADAYVSGLTIGTYTYRFTVIDNRGEISTDDVTVTVNPINNNAPLADAGDDATITTSYTTVLLNASRSKDTDGYLTSVYWSKVSGPVVCNIENCHGVTTHAANLLEGVYVFRVMVKDNRGDSSFDDVKVTVNNPGKTTINKLPIADAGTDHITTIDRPRVLLRGYRSRDTDGWIPSFAWTKVSGPAGSVIEDTKLANPYLSGLVEGVYVYRFTVTDNKGATSFDDVTITVTASTNKLPLANAGQDKTIKISYPTVLLTGYESRDTDGYLVALSWSKISGPDGDVIAAPNGVNTHVSGLKEGSYVYRLTVKDNIGATSTDDVVVTVTNPYVVSSFSSIAGPNVKEELTAYPNPAKDVVTLSYSSAALGKSIVIFYDAYGMPARTVQFEKSQILHQIQVNITDLSHGMYHVVVTTGGTKMQTTILKQ